ERRLRARVLSRPQRGHAVRDAGEGDRLQPADVALDAEAADLAHRVLRALVVAPRLRPLVGRPERVEAAGGGGRLPGPHVDHLVARRRDEEKREDGGGEHRHRPAALVACTKAIRSSYRSPSMSWSSCGVRRPSVFSFSTPRSSMSERAPSMSGGSPSGPPMRSMLPCAPREM